VSLSTLTTGTAPPELLALAGQTNPASPVMSGPGRLGLYFPFKFFELKEFDRIFIKYF
jgi:hypothetical protein